MNKIWKGGSGGTIEEENIDTEKSSLNELEISKYSISKLDNEEDAEDNVHKLYDIETPMFSTASSLYSSINSLKSNTNYFSNLSLLSNNYSLCSSMSHFSPPNGSNVDSCLFNPVLGTNNFFFPTSSMSSSSLHTDGNDRNAYVNYSSEKKRNDFCKSFSEELEDEDLYAQEVGGNLIYEGGVMTNSITCSNNKSSNILCKRIERGIVSREQKMKENEAKCLHVVDQDMKRLGSSNSFIDQNEMYSKQDFLIENSCVSKSTSFNNRNGRTNKNKIAYDDYSNMRKNDAKSEAIQEKTAEFGKERKKNFFQKLNENYKNLFLFDFSYFKLRRKQENIGFISKIKDSFLSWFTLGMEEKMKKERGKEKVKAHNSDNVTNNSISFVNDFNENALEGSNACLNSNSFFYKRKRGEEEKREEERCSSSMLSVDENQEWMADVRRAINKNGNEKKKKIKEEQQGLIKLCETKQKRGKFFRVEKTSGGDLGERVGDLGERVGDLGERDGDLGERDGDLGERDGDLGEIGVDIGEEIGGGFNLSGGRRKNLKIKTNTFSFGNESDVNDVVAVHNSNNAKAFNDINLYASKAFPEKPLSKFASTTSFSSHSGKVNFRNIHNNDNKSLCNDGNDLNIRDAYYHNSGPKFKRNISNCSLKQNCSCSSADEGAAIQKKSKILDNKMKNIDLLRNTSVRNNNLTFYNKGSRNAASINAASINAGSINDIKMSKYERKLLNNMMKNRSNKSSCDNKLISVSISQHLDKSERKLLDREKIDERGIPLCTRNGDEQLKERGMLDDKETFNFFCNNSNTVIKQDEILRKRGNEIQPYRLDFLGCRVRDSLVSLIIALHNNEESSCGEEEAEVNFFSFPDKCNLTKRKSEDKKEKNNNACGKRKKNIFIIDDEEEEEEEINARKLTGKAEDNLSKNLFFPSNCSSSSSSFLSSSSSSSSSSFFSSSSSFSSSISFSSASRFSLSSPASLVLPSSPSRWNETEKRTKKASMSKMINKKAKNVKINEQYENFSINNKKINKRRTANNKVNKSNLKGSIDKSINSFSPFASSLKPIFNSSFLSRSGSSSFPSKSKLTEFASENGGILLLFYYKWMKDKIEEMEEDVIKINVLNHLGVTKTCVRSDLILKDLVGLQEENVESTDTTEKEKNLEKKHICAKNRVENERRNSSSSCQCFDCTRKEKTAHRDMGETPCIHIEETPYICAEETECMDKEAHGRQEHAQKTKVKGRNVNEENQTNQVDSAQKTRDAHVESLKLETILNSYVSLYKNVEKRSNELNEKLTCFTTPGNFKQSSKPLNHVYHKNEWMKYFHISNNILQAIQSLFPGSSVTVDCINIFGSMLNKIDLMFCEKPEDRIYTLQGNMLPISYCMPVVYTYLGGEIEDLDYVNTIIKSLRFNVGSIKCRMRWSGAREGHILLPIISNEFTCFLAVFTITKNMECKTNECTYTHKYKLIEISADNCNIYGKYGDMLNSYSNILQSAKNICQLCVDNIHYETKVKFEKVEGIDCVFQNLIDSDLKKNNDTTRISTFAASDEGVLLMAIIESYFTMYDPFLLTSDCMYILRYFYANRIFDYYSANSLENISFNANSSFIYKEEKSSNSILQNLQFKLN